MRDATSVPGKSPLHRVRGVANSLIAPAAILLFNLHARPFLRERTWRLMVLLE